MVGGWVVATNFNVSSRKGFQFFGLLGATRGLLLTILCRFLPDPCLSFTKTFPFSSVIVTTGGFEHDHESFHVGPLTRVKVRAVNRNFAKVPGEGPYYGEVRLAAVGAGAAQ